MTTTATNLTPATTPATRALGELSLFTETVPNRLSVLGGFDATADPNETLLACSLSWTVSIV